MSQLGVLKRALFSLFIVVAVVVVGGSGAVGSSAAISIPIRETGFSTQAPEGSQAVSVQSPTNEFTLLQGETKDTIVTVVNDSDYELTFDTRLANFTSTEDTGTTEFYETNDFFGLLPFMDISPKVATVPSHKFLEFTVTITIPELTPSGGRYGVAFFIPRNPSLPDGSAINTVQQAGSLFFVKVGGDAAAKGDITKFIPDGGDKLLPLAFLSGPEQFVTELRNTGNAHSTIRGKIRVKNMFGDPVGKPLQINDGEVGNKVLPGKFRTFETPWKHKFLWGMYTAKLEVNFGNGQLLTKKVQFFVIPLWPSIFALLGTLLLISLLTVLRSRIWNALRALLGMPPTGSKRDKEREKEREAEIKAAAKRAKQKAKARNNKKPEREQLSRRQQKKLDRSRQKRSETPTPAVPVSLAPPPIEQQQEELVRKAHSEDAEMGAPQTNSDRDLEQERERIRKYEEDIERERARIRALQLQRERAVLDQRAEELRLERERLERAGREPAAPIPPPVDSSPLASPPESANEPSTEPAAEPVPEEQPIPRAPRGNEKPKRFHWRHDLPNDELPPDEPPRVRV